MKPEEIRVVDFGIRPDDGADATPAIKAALEACRAKPSAKLVFDPGHYDLRTGPNFEISNFHDLAIEGKGAELVGHQVENLFSICNSRNITIRNLSVDWHPLPFTGGKVANVRSDHFDLEVVPPHTVQSKRPIYAVLGYYDPNRGRLKYDPEGFYDIYVFEHLETDIAKAGTIRVPLPSNRNGPLLGKYVVVRHPGRRQCTAFRFVNCADVCIEGVNVYTVPGFALYAHRCHNFSLKRYSVMIKPGTKRWFSSIGDGSHFNNCRGMITIEDCFFECMGDDATNIHNMFSVVVQKLDKRTLALTSGRAYRDNAKSVPIIPLAGDHLEIGGGDNPLIPSVAAIVESVEVDGAAGLAIVKFSEDLPARVAPGDVVGNADDCPVARIRRCTIRSNRARGMLIQTRDVIIEDCTFEQNSAAGLHITCDSNYWWEGIGVRNVTVRNNLFSGCAFGAASQHGVINIFAEVGQELAGAGVHRAITIENNTIRDAHKAAIHVGSAEGVTIRNNTILNPRNEAIIITNSSNVSVSDNKLIDGKVGLKLGPGLYRETIHAYNNTGF